MHPLGWKDIWANYMAFVDFGTPMQYGPTDNVTTKSPRDGYIDGGLVLRRSMKITRHELYATSYDDWEYFKSMTTALPNVIIEEDIDRQLTLISTAVPVITSLTI